MNRPVEQVSWDDIQIFLERLNEQEADNRPRVGPNVLPTEAQWEYACRVGTTTVYFWGAIQCLDQYDSNEAKESLTVWVKPVWIFDMHFCLGMDRGWFAYEAGPLTDPTGAGIGLASDLSGWFLVRRRGVPAFG